MESIDESLKIFLQEIVEYVCAGNDVLFKTNNLLFNARTISPFTAWVVIYKAERLSLVTSTENFDVAISSIFNFIHTTDRESNESGNS
jgi:hypothetical protein|nr:MAG TPA: hypothetical protein [Caudoviricetes sp.]